MINKPFHIPDTVKVGCFVFKVEQTPKVAKDQALKGQCRHYDKVIRIDSEMQPCDKRETLWHEIIHAVDDFMSLGLSETLGTAWVRQSLWCRWITQTCSGRRANRPRFTRPSSPARRR